MLGGSAKLTLYQGRKLEILINAQVDVMLERMSKNLKKSLRNEVPVKTGNLRDSQVIGDIIQIGQSKGVNVGTDQDQAPYAPYVYFPMGLHGFNTKTDRPRRWLGNDWITRALNRSMGDSIQIISQTLLDLNRIKI